MNPPSPFFRLYHCTDFSATGLKQFSSYLVETVELQTSAEAIPVSFDAVGSRFENRSNVHFEWDGSMVWTGEKANRRWQVDLQIYDLGESIQYVEWKGTCPVETWVDFGNVMNDSKWLTSELALVGHWIEHDVWLAASAIGELMRQMNAEATLGDE